MKICQNCKKEFTGNSNAQKKCNVCKYIKCSFCHIGFVPNCYHSEMKFCSKKCYSLSQKGKYPVNLKGKRGVKPRGFKKTERNKLGSVEDIEWRNAVFSRDKFVCQDCLVKGKRLQAHHIKPYKLFPELRHELKNGITLCLDCHKKTDSFGWKNYWNNYIAEERIRSISNPLF